VAAANDAVAITAAEAAKDVAEVMAIVHAEKHAREEIERHSIPNSENLIRVRTASLRSNISEALSAGTTHGAIKLPKGEGLAAATLYCSSRLCCSRVEQPRSSLHLKCAVRYVTVRGRLCCMLVVGCWRPYNINHNQFLVAEMRPGWWTLKT
jgi:hypothetical protein